MINLRYHIMSLIAVLLASVLGVAAGSAVVDKGLVNQLENNLDRLDHNLSDASKTNDRLSGQLKDLRDKAKRATTSLVTSMRMLALGRTSV